MRILEIISVLLLFVASIFVVWGNKGKKFNQSKKLYVGVLSSLIVVFGLHAIIEHVRVQMIPAYVVLAIVIASLLYKIVKYEQATKTNRTKEAKRSLQLTLKSLSTLVLVVLLAAATVFSSLLPVFTMPEPSGDYAVGTISKNLTDETRTETLNGDLTGNIKREVAINVWYPVDKAELKQQARESFPPQIGEAVSLVFGLPKQLFSHVSLINTHVVANAKLSDTQQSYPVVLFSPGVRSTRFQSMTTIEELVSRGYIVVGMDHPYTSAHVELANGKDAFYTPNPEFDTSKELYDSNVEGVAIRANDAKFILDQLELWNKQDGLFANRLNLDKIGMFGHSYGGATTVETMAQDERIKAGVSLEGGFWGTVSQKGLKQPFMYIMSGKTEQSLDPNSGVKEAVSYEEFLPDLQSVMKKSTNDTYYLVVDHFYHQSFTDIALVSPLLFSKEMDAVHSVDITRSYVGAFFDQYLKGEENQLLDGASNKYPEVHFSSEYTKKAK
jgi:predicted dienelactone hydrolase